MTDQPCCANPCIVEKYTGTTLPSHGHVLFYCVNCGARFER